MVNVFDIERFATHDGPGIRTVVFLKGCPLRCPWCSNPESQSIYPEIFKDENGKETVVGKEVKIEEIVRTVLKDNAYYKKSKGGVTISGGEPFFQAESMFQLVQAFKKEKLHVAVETTGNSSLENIQRCEPYIDLFLYDLKHVDENKLSSIKANKKVILNNLKWLSRHCNEKVVVRIPVIPSFNQEDLVDLLDMCEHLGIKEVHCLPYHDYGKNKYRLLDRKYPMEGVKTLNKSDVEKLVKKKYSFNLLVHG